MHFYCEWTGGIVVIPSHMSSTQYVMVVLMTLGGTVLCTFIVNGQVALWSPQPT